jgi:hypothetical protein
VWNHERRGSSPDVTRPHRLLLGVTAVVASILLSACGSDPPKGDAAPSSPATAGQTTVAPEGESGSDQQADLSLKDQSGDGSSVVVGTVSAPQGGFVVVTTADDASTVLGSAQLKVGTTDDVRVPLDPALSQDTALQVTLYADTDGDGLFDPDKDKAVPEPVSGEKPSTGGVVHESARYTVR